MNTAARHDVSRVRHAYGDQPSQFGDLYCAPTGPPRGAIVLVHGGFWRPHRGLEMTESAAVALAERGWRVWNVEYRRGVPWRETLDDCVAAVEYVAQLSAGGPTILVGHSAGGHLAAWVAGTQQNSQRPDKVVTLNGVVDLGMADQLHIGDDAVAHWLGPDASEVDRAAADPVTVLPSVPVVCVHSRADERVPFAISASYHDKARRAGRDCRLVEVSGHHTAVIETDGPAWQTVLAVIDGDYPNDTAGEFNT